MNNANCTGTSSVARMDIGNWIAQYALTIGRNGICTTGTRFGDNQANTTFIFDNAVSSCGMYIGNASSGGNLHLITGAEKRLTITSTGIACFSSTVCAPCFATISDYRMKSNVRPIEGLSIIMNTKPYKFEYNYDCSTSFGMIAHELQDTLPEAVFGEKDGEVMQGVDYMKLLPIAIKAIQELKAENDIFKTCLGIS